MDFNDLKKIPLAEFCISRLGYTPNKGHDSKLWRSLKSRSGVKIITKSTPNSQGHYLFKCSDQDLSGSVIDLLLRIEGFNHNDIRDYFGSPTLPIINPPDPPCVDRDTDNTSAVERHVFNNSASSIVMPNYLSRRGLSRTTIEYFGLKPKFEAFSIPLYRLFEGRWRAQTSITYFFDKNGSRIRLFQSGLQRRDSFCLLKPTGSKISKYNTLHIFESPIDALSYAQIGNFPQTLYMATCGALTNDFLTSLPGVVDSLRIKQVYCCFDNDEAGNKMSERVSITLSGHTKRLRSTKKDWNEDLN